MTFQLVGLQEVFPLRVDHVLVRLSVVAQQRRLTLRRRRDDAEGRADGTQILVSMLIKRFPLGADAPKQ
jgi:hypothetical protein